MDPNSALRGGLGNEIEASLDGNSSYAVRSSANIEDLLSGSFAGQFRSVLDVRGPDAVLKAVTSVCRSADSPEVASYLAKTGRSPAELKMAVVIQQMVSPVVSGVAFSRNPVTGLDEVVVEAVRGSGEQLVQDGITPARWVNKWGEYTSRPKDSDIPPEVVDEVVQGTKQIARKFRRAVDLEWVWDGARLWWVQVREITAIDNINIYSNRISREFLPGMIKPLVWSVNIPLVNSAWIRLLDELVGHSGLKPEDLARAFHYRAYFSLSAIGRVFEALGLPQETLELLLGIESTGPEKPKFKPSARTWLLLPRMLWSSLKMWRFERRVRPFIPVMRERFDRMRSENLAGKNENQLLDHVDCLFEQGTETAYYNIVVPLLMQLYNRLVKRRLERSGLDYERYDPVLGMDELEGHDPKTVLNRLHAEFEGLGEDARSRVRSNGYSALSVPELASFRRSVDDFIDRFGHFSSSGNDFSARPWREDPDLVVRMIADHRPPEPSKSGSTEIGKALRGPLSRMSLRRARRFRIYREQVSSIYTYGYGLFRDVFFELGERLVARGLLDDRDDILYLYLDEVRGAVAGADADLRNLAGERRREMKAVENAPLPTIIFGDDAPPVYDETGSRLKGTPTSRGYYRGPVTVVRDPANADRLQNGDVLVIPYSDVGWTPLFARAGAVVSGSGGILSHSSIIAREYGIPAVVSVPGALDIPDGTVVAVDGYKGEIAIQEEPAP
jgi:phosphohistidine swiveling domain-containing protein